MRGRVSPLARRFARLAPPFIHDRRWDPGGNEADRDLFARSQIQRVLDKGARFGLRVGLTPPGACVRPWLHRVPFGG